MQRSCSAAVQPSLVQVRPLPAAQPALRQLSKLFAASRGPHSQLTLVRNATSEGHVTLTSSAGPLLRGMSSSQGPVRLVLSALSAHVARWPDAGLLTAHLCAAFSSADLPVPRRVVAETREIITTALLEYLNADDCPCRVLVSDVNSMCALVSCMLLSKPACHLNEASAAHISQLILQAFLQCADHGTIQYVLVRGSDPCACEIIDGVLFEAPHIAPYTNPSMPSGPLLVALFSASLSGDSAPIGATIELPDHIVWADAVVARIIRCAEQLVALDVRMLICQRVVHPRVKRFMRKHNVMVLDRLGLPYIESVRLVTGAVLLSDYCAPVQHSQLGCLRSVKHRVLNERSYLQLEATDKPVCTLVLHARSEEALDELKCVAADGVLESVMRGEPHALMGAGCWQSHLAGYLRRLSREKRADWADELGCSPTTVTLIADDMAQTLASSAWAVAKQPTDAYFDPRSPHHTSHAVGGATCQCGAVLLSEAVDDNFECICDIGQCKVLDPFEATLKALTSAVAISNMTICIEHYIKDNN